MTSSRDSARTAAPAEASTRAARNWVVVIARAIPAVVAAIVITFTADHSATLGFVVFGGFGILSGSAVLARAMWAPGAGAARIPLAIAGGVSVLAGLAGLMLSSSGIATLVALLVGWSAITGLIELATGILQRRSHPEARDWRFAGAITAAFAAVVLIVPPGFSQRFTGPDEVERALTASVIVVGAFGAYAAILGVFQIIAGLSVKWAANPSERGRADVAGNGLSL